jgi:hypothetical protein
MAKYHKERGEQEGGGWNSQIHKAWCIGAKAKATGVGLRVLFGLVHRKQGIFLLRKEGAFCREKEIPAGEGGGMCLPGSSIILPFLVV